MGAEIREMEPSSNDAGSLCVLLRACVCMRVCVIFVLAHFLSFMYLHDRFGDEYVVNGCCKSR